MKLHSAWIVVLSVVGLCAPALADDDRQLIDRAAARQERPAAAPPAAAPVADVESAMQERQAQIELTLAQVRVDLIQARKAYRSGDAALATARARAVLSALATLPDSIDASAYELQAEGILARSSSPRSAQSNAPEQSNAAARSTPSGRSAPTLSDGGSATNARRAARVDHGYRPTADGLDMDAVRSEDQARLAYEAALWQGYSAWETDHLVDAHASRDGPGPGEWVQYPANWPEIVRKRERYKDGVVARGSSTRDADGREWFVAVYEVNDLTYVPPDFQLARGRTPDEELRIQLDRDALRNQSQIFRGWPEDLAAGIPLLRFFGGADDFAMRGSKFSAQKHREILEMVRTFTESQGSFTPQVGSFGP
ncbi:MAG: hypothetical protein IPM64_08715 [Phycisphaerales bacterium]|nr:hypothetical protein [Phycisphaerales bacterium]